MVLIQCLGLADGRLVHVGDFLRSWDPEGNEGRGSFLWTNDPELAIWFPSAKEALEEWSTQSTTVPLRPDGQPNKPMTMFSVAIVPLLSVLEVKDGNE